MNEKWDYHAIDKAMSKRIEEIFFNPKKHQFYSYYQAYLAEDRRGARGARIKGRKTMCFHCGDVAKAHAGITEAI